MKLTTEQKSRIFALYIGAPVRYTNLSGYTSSQIIDVHEIGRVAEGGAAFYKIILRPLSAITDEDAIEVAKITGTPINAEILKIRRDRKSWVEIEYRWVNEIPLLNNEDGYSYSATGVPIKEVGNVACFQYLIQRGYAVPLFVSPGHPSNGLTAIELGLAIDSTK